MPNQNTTPRSITRVFQKTIMKFGFFKTSLDLLGIQTYSNTFAGLATIGSSLYRNVTTTASLVTNELNSGNGGGDSSRNFWPELTNQFNNAGLAFLSSGGSVLIAGAAIEVFKIAFDMHPLAANVVAPIALTLFYELMHCIENILDLDFDGPQSVFELT